MIAELLLAPLELVFGLADAPPVDVATALLVFVFMLMLPKPDVNGVSKMSLTESLNNVKL